MDQLTTTAVAGAMVAAVAFGAGWKVQGWRWDASLKAQAEANVLALQQNELKQAALRARIEAQLAQEREAREKDKADFEARLKRVPKTKLVKVYIKAKPAPGREPKVEPVDVDLVRLSDDYRRLWNAALANSLPAAERAAWTDGANTAPGAVEVDDTLRNLERNTALLGQCRSREAGWHDWARQQGLVK